MAALAPPTADAQAIVQQTAVVLWEKFDQYFASRPFAPWACRFALNVTRQWMARRQRWKVLFDGHLAEEWHCNGPGFDRTAVSAMSDHDIRCASSGDNWWFSIPTREYWWPLLSLFRVGLLLGLKLGWIHQR